MDWLNAIQQQNNASGRTKVIDGFLNSTEYKTHYVTSLYEIILGRAPDAAGLAFWTAKMGNPGTAGQNDGSADEKFVIAAILGSDELAIPLDLEKSYEESCHALGIA